MTIPEWLKPGIYGVIIGGIAVSVLGFSWGGWVTGDGASKMATTMAQEEVVAALVPLCLEKSLADPDRVAILETIKSVSSFNRHKEIMAAGWATAPGGDTPDRELARACIPVLEL